MEIEDIRGLDPTKVYFIEVSRDATAEEYERLCEIIRNIGLKAIVIAAGLITFIRVEGDGNEQESNNPDSARPPRHASDNSGADS